MNRIDNIKRRRPARAALVLGPTLLAILGPMGVVASPFLSYGKTKLELAGLARESKELRTAVEQHLEFLDGRAVQQARSQTATLDSLIPAPSSPVLVHTLLRLLGRSLHLSLESITIGDLNDPGLERLGDYIGAREIRLRGDGSIQALIALPTTLESLGFPNTVSAFNLTRSSVKETTFSLSLTLSLFECADPPPSEDSPSNASSTGGP